MPTTRVSTDSLTPTMPSVKNQSLVFHPMTYTIGQTSNFNLSNPVCLFGLRIFGVSLQASQRLSTLSRTFIAGYICLTKNKIWVFHPGGEGGIYPILLHQSTRNLLLLLLFYTIVSLDFGRCPISELVTHSPRIVNNITMHPHPTRRDVTVHMKFNHVISCYVIPHA